MLRVADIMLDGKSAAKAARKAERSKAERERVEEAAVAQAAEDAELAAKLALGSDDAVPAKNATKGKAKADRPPRPRRSSRRRTSQGQGRRQTGQGQGRQERGRGGRQCRGRCRRRRAPVPRCRRDRHGTKAAAPKRSTAKAPADVSDAPDAEADAAPKRTRATKKDE